VVDELCRREVVAMMELPNAQDLLIIIGCLITFSFIAGLIQAASEQRKSRKDQEERERLQGKAGKE